MTTRKISWGKGGWCVGLIKLSPSISTSWNPQGLSRSAMGMLSLSLIWIYGMNKKNVTFCSYVFSPFIVQVR
jgi:hypothetical protein